MKQSFVIFTLQSALCSLLSILYVQSATAAVRVNNQSRGYAAAYQQVAAMRQQAEYYNQQQPQATAENLPVRVASSDLAEQIARGDTSAGVGMTNLEACARIYPSGSFAWDRPTSGHNINQPTTCVAVVELRQYTDGINDTVLARANIAAGDAIDCNISNFPEATYTNEAGNVTFPADREPTVDDVIKIMNDEQKKNAGFKIAAGAALGGIGGYLTGKKDVATGKKDTTGAVVGALSGAGIMAGSSYAGKVGGDMILSAGVNATAGGVIGNMIGSGDSVLRIEKCKVNEAETTCLWGILQKGEKLASPQTGFYNISNNKTAVCETNSGNTFSDCTEKSIIALVFDNYYNSVEEGIADQGFLKIKEKPNEQYTFNIQNKTMTNGYSDDSGGIWIKATSAVTPSERIAAMIPDFHDKTFGVKMTDWYKWRNDQFNKNAPILSRNTKGEAGNLNGVWTLQQFYPLTVDADDGGVIDINNKARLKSTLIGAGAGAGLGAFTAYQGAQDEIDARWVSAVQEYKDSLQKFYCATGTRFLSQYNDAVIIPNMSEY